MVHDYMRTELTPGVFLLNDDGSAANQRRVVAFRDSSPQKTGRQRHYAVISKDEDARTPIRGLSQEHESLRQY